MRDPLSIEAFADWCDKQPADKAYSFTCVPCAVEQYADSLGIGRDTIWGHSLGSFWCQSNIIAADYPHTFGALAQRLRSA